MSVLSEGHVRRARQEDLDRVVEIERQSFPTPRSASALRYDLRRDCFLVYEELGEIVGYVIIDVESSPPWMSVFEGEIYGHILDIAVAPEHRRKGVGEELMRAGMAALSETDAEKAKLEVRVGNDAAMEMYEKLGFETVRRLKSYYSNGDDAWLMVRDLE